ncbi:hypothetical protein RN001_007071 [Aquatica leii]|uniref:Uncharacterized protein n=1 Tax=Aquatica leii TaxID=1421715 RepID=A0AAN7SQS5_9COLE|nr:hypothetical protein RN001_007071 [Aquatica leii]
MYLKLFFFLLSTILLVKTTLAVDSNHTTLLKENSARLFEDVISKAVECIRQFLINGIEGFSLDPLEYPFYRLDLDTPSISSSLNLTNIFVGGLASFTLDKGTVSVFPQTKAEIALSFGQIKVKTDYDGDMKIADLLKLFGKGSFSLQFDNLKVSVVAVVNLIPLSIKELNLQIQLPSTKAVITGLFNNEYMSDLISRQMSETLTQLAQEQQTNFNNLINELLKQLLNLRIVPVLENLNFDELVEMAQNDAFSCDLGVQTAFRLFYESMNDVLAQSNINLNNYFNLKR